MLSSKNRLRYLVLILFVAISQFIPSQLINAQNKLDLAGLPDSIPFAAYSVRKLSNTYTGPAMQVRRGSDNLTADIAFDGSNVISSSSFATVVISNIALSNVTSFPAKTGTITALTTSAVITGVGTSFTTQVAIGDIIIDASGKKTIGVVVSITSNTILTLSANAVAAVSAKAFTVTPSVQTFSTFYGSSSCYVRIWYDQSGNTGARDVTQNINNAFQPRIVNSGNFDLNGTIPSVYFSKSGGSYLTTNLAGASISYPLTISTLANTRGDSTGGPFVQVGSTGGIATGIGNGVNSSPYNFSTLGRSVTAARINAGTKYSVASPDVKYPINVFTTTTVLNQYSATSYLLRIFLNGANTPLANATSTPVAISSQAIFLGMSGANASPNVYESEVIIFNSSLVAAVRTPLECNQQTYYSILKATVGPTQNVCGSLNSDTLGGNVPAYGFTGRWSQVSGPVGGVTTFSSVINNNSIASVNIAGTYVYEWLVSNGSCNAAANITVNYSSAANTGINQNICGSLMSDSLGANIPTIGVGAWSKISGPGSVSFSNPGSADAVATVNAYGSYVFRWTITGGTCSPSTADITVNYSSSTNPPPTANISGTTSICPGNAATITVNLTGTAPWNLTYTDGTNTFNIGNILSTPYTFSVSPASTSTYKLTNVTDAYCVAQLVNLSSTVTISVAPKVIITPDYCSLGGGVVKLSADTHSTYLWSPSGQTTQSIVASQSGFYSVKITDAAYPGCSATTSFSLGDELVYNGDFSLGNVGFVTDYALPSAPKNCANSGSGGLYPSGTYDILTDPQTAHCNFWGTDHTTGNGNFMVVNGGSDTLKIWGTNSIPVQKNTRYYFSAWAMSLNNSIGTAALRFKVGAYPVGNVAVLAPGVNSNLNAGWKRFYGFWDSGDTTSVTIQIIDTITHNNGNDFGLDDISFSTLPPVGLGVTATSVGGPNFCSGESVDLSSSVAGGWSPLKYIWTFASGPSTLANPNIPSIKVTDNNIKLVVTDDKGCKDSSQFVLTINNAKTWLGVNTDWFDKSNWCGGIPDSTSDVTIPFISAGIYPVITTGTAATKNLIMTGGGSINVNGGAVQVAAAINKTGGILNATNGKVEFNGLVAQSVKGSWFQSNIIKDLQVTNSTGVTLSSISNDSLNVTGVLSFGAGNGLLNTGNNLVLVSSASGTARVADLTNNGSASGNTINGKVTVQRYIPGRRAWRLLTAPLSGAGLVFSTWQNGGNYAVGKGTFVTGPGPTGAGGNGLDPSNQNNLSLKAGTYLTGIINTKTTLLSTNTGTADNKGFFLFVRGDRNPVNTDGFSFNNTTLSSSGTLQTGTQLFSLIPKKDSFTLVGNPYASPIDFQSLTRTNVANRFIVWDPKANQVGAYVYIDDPYNTGTYLINPIYPGGQDTLIQSGQAFFVQTTVAGPATLEFNETDKATNNNTAIFRPANGNSPATATTPTKGMRINLNLVNGANSTIADGTYVQFTNLASAAVDNYDALKFGNVNEMISLQRHGALLAVERRPDISLEDTLYLRVSKTTQRSYQVAIVPTNLDASIAIFLNDKFTGLQTPLSATGTSLYDFQVNGQAASAATDRFMIVFKPAGVLPVTLKTVKAYQKGNAIAVDWTVSNEINIRSYEVEKSPDGNNFKSIGSVTARGLGANETAYSLDDLKPVNGNNFYRIRIIENSGKIAYSSLVKVNMGKGAGLISVYPNPVTGNSFGLELSNMPAGKYKLKLTNTIGQLVFADEIAHSQGTSVEIINTGKVLNAGIYQLEVTGVDQQTKTIKIVVQ